MKNLISVLFVGDIVGQPGLDILALKLPELKEQYKSDFTIVNGENAAAGRGITEVESKQIFNAGADVITTGNHVWDSWKGKPLLASDAQIVRPMNYPSGNVGKGYVVCETEDGVKIAVLQLQGRTYMQTIDCPFKTAEYAVKQHLEPKTNIIIVDFHADATGEKIALGWFLDGSVSAIIGTHTHVPTADATILPNGTGFISDVGMTGPYDSVLGLRKEVAIKRLTLQTPHKYEIAEKDPRLCAVHLLINVHTGQTIKIEQIIIPKYERTVQYDCE